jgi:hypothetical protein
VLCGTSVSAVNKHRARRGGGRAKPTLAEHLRRATPAELAGAARAVGVDLVWDRMIAPAIS